MILLLIGSNNLRRALGDRRPISGLRAAYWVLRLARLLQVMWQRSPSTWTIVAKPVMPGDAQRPLRIYRAGIALLTAVLGIAGMRISMIDLAAENDGTHYTPEGHRAVARLWCAEIMRVLPHLRRATASTSGRSRGGKLGEEG